MSFLPALGVDVVGTILQNIQNKAAIQNQQNAENNALSITGQNGAAANAALNRLYANNPFYQASAPTAPTPVSGQGAPTMQGPTPTPAPPGQGQVGGPAAPAAAAAPQAGQAPGGRQGQISPQLVAALMRALQPKPGGQPGAQPPGGFQAPTPPPRPLMNPQAAMQSFYGAH